MSIRHRPKLPVPVAANRPGQFTTALTPRHLAWLALQARLHSGDLLRSELQWYLWGKKESEVAMTFIDGEPVCVALLTDYCQLMVYTRKAYRGLGLAKRTARHLSRRTGFALECMTGGPGRRPELSKSLFASLGVEYIP
jgi:hypothetical protein